MRIAWLRRPVKLAAEPVIGKVAPQTASGSNNPGSNNLDEML
jgi:hypothetical protein